MRNLRDTVFYRKTNVLQDFRSCISVPLTKSFMYNFLLRRVEQGMSANDKIVIAR